MPDTPSHLWKRLGATAPLVSVRSGVLAHGDDATVSQVVITRTSSMSGQATTTAQVDLPAPIARTRLDPADVTQRYQVQLTAHALARLSALEPTIDVDAVRDRFVGALASVQLSDLGDRREGAWRAQAVFTDHLTAQLRGRGYGFSQYAGGVTGSRLDALLESVLVITGLQPDVGEPADPAYPRLAVLGTTEWHYARHLVTDPAYVEVPARDVLSWLTDCGHLLRVTRAGLPQLLSHSYLMSTAAAATATSPAVAPLTRSQVLAPTTWERGPGRLLSLVTTVTRPNGTVATIETYSGLGNAEELDLTSVVGELMTGAPQVGPYFALRARVARESPSAWTLDRVTVDVARLLTSTVPADRAQAARLLKLEVGDPLLLTNDWPHPDVMYVEQIVERITAAGWSLELLLTPSLHVGVRGALTIPPGDTWQTSYPRETTWDAVPNDPAWDEA